MLNPRSLYIFRLRTLLNRIYVVGGIILYIKLYNYLYIHWLAPTFSYAGMTYHPPALSMLVLAWVLAVLPSLWMPVKVTRTSQIPYWFIYLLVYVPSMFSPLYMALQSNYRLAILMACLVAGFLIISCCYLIPPIRLTHHLIPVSVFWPAVIALTVLLDLWVIAIYHSHIHLVGFNKIYALRSQASRLGQGTGVGYAMTILSSLLDPLYIAYGLVKKRNLPLVLGGLNQLLLYSVGGSKAVVLSAVIILGIFILMRKSGWDFGVRLIGATLAVLGALVIISFFSHASIILRYAISILFSRTFANGGYTTGLYSSFFQSHPLTYLSNVHGIGFFVHYPYSEPLGLVIGYGAVGSRTLDANAHFWAMDGLAAFGPPGIVIISILCALVFWVLDSAASRHDIVFCSLTVAFETIVLTNTSLFTTLISGGLALLVLLLMGMPAIKSMDDTQRHPLAETISP